MVLLNLSQNVWCKKTLLFNLSQNDWFKNTLLFSLPKYFGKRKREQIGIFAFIKFVTKCLI